MVDINSVFPSKYLRCDDLNDTQHLCTINHVSFEDMKGQRKIVLHFKEWEKPLICNKTNANTIAEWCSPETDGWIGKQVVLVPSVADFQGQSVAAIRIRKPKPIPPSAKAMAAQAPAGPPKGHPAAFDDDLEAPF